jgi:putative ABC transport system permease protein
MLHRLRAWVRALARHDAVEQEMHAEMQYHLDRAVERLMARGLPREAAQREARREFGIVAAIQEDAREAWGVRGIEDAGRDVRHAVRALRRTPGFMLAVVATLALGLGGSVTMFEVIDRLLLRPPDHLIAPERSHHLYFARIVNGTEAIAQAYQYQRFRDIAASSTTAEVVAAYSSLRLPVGSGDAARETLVGAASASFWKLFDARPAIGRFFTTADDRDVGGAHVAVLSHAYWESEYGGSPAVIGTTIVIEPGRYTVIGVAPRGLTGVERETPSLFVPMAVLAADEFGAAWATDRTGYAQTWVQLYARRRAGTTVAAATADLSAALRASWRKQMALEPVYTVPIEVAKPRIIPSAMQLERGPRPSADARVATWLFGVTAIVLLIACANVGNLLLARALSRQREIAVRLTLGAGRGRVVRSLLIESMILALLGGLAAIVLARWGGQVLRAVLLPGIEWQGGLADGRTLAFAAVATVIAGLVSGIVPVVQSSRPDLIAAVRAGAREGHGRRSRLRTILMLVQVALSAMLLIGAGLFVRSVDRVGRLRLGYDADRLLAINIRTRGTALDSTAQVALRRALVERAQAHPLVESVTLACSVPFSGTCTQRVFVEGVDSTSRFGEFVRQIASPAYFTTVGTRILRGRGIVAGDRAGAPFVAVVSEAMARVLWPGQDAIGKCFRTGTSAAPCRMVVGIAENVTQERVGDEAGLEYYVPAVQDVEYRGRLIVRTRGDPREQSEILRRDLASVMPPSGSLMMRPIGTAVRNVTRPWRLGAVTFVAFGALALVVAAIGLSGVVAFGVTQRRHEIAVRIALGARATDVIALVVGDGARVVMAGTLGGMALALAAAPWLGPLLFRVSPRDPFVFGAVGVVLIGVALVASGLPARRASLTDPASALRSD